ncbi:MAG: AAA family ATPase [Bacteroidota bacterium]
MAYSLSVPFFAFRLRLHSGGSFLSPLLDAEVLYANGPLEVLAGKYANAFQSKVLDKGQLMKLLNEGPEGPFYRAEIPIAFPAAKDGYSYPAFELAFDYYYTPTSRGTWGLLPSVGIEAFADDELALERTLKEAVRLEFARKRRLRDIHQVIAAIWYDTTELLRHDVQLRFHTPRELEAIQEGQKEQLLPRVAQALDLKSRVVYGRKTELDQLARAVKNKFSNSVLLVGPTGVGKTALVWELARQRKKRRLEATIWETTASVLIKELTGDTGWQDNLAFLCGELLGGKDILFVRNLLELFEVGQYAGNEVSMAEYLREYISRGEVRIISECSEEERARIELRSPNFLSFFQIIQLEEPRDDLESIVFQKTSALAKAKSTELDAEAIRESIRLHHRFQPYAGFPGKPIRFLESIVLNEVHRYQGKIGRREIVAHFCEETGMPLFMVDPEVPMEPSKIKGRFNTQVFGQEKAVEEVVDTLSAVKTALSRTGKPIASFLFVGPTGVGKTELAKVLSRFMFGSEERMIRFDMSEFSDSYSVMRLIGETYFSDGLLTSAIRREPFCVLLFDEIEKAHPSFYDLLLQMLGEGRLTDSRGQLVNFCSTIIIMTSNIGATNLSQSRISLAGGTDPAVESSHFRQAAEKHFRPELFNRIDKIIPFASLNRETVRYVVDREIRRFRQREGIRFRNMNLGMNDGVMDFLARTGYDPKYGARQLQRSIQEQLIVPLAKALNLIDYDDQLMVEVAVVNEALDIQIEVDPMGLDLLMEELDKINFADHASRLRRQMTRFKEGHFFNRLMSRLDILEREKNKSAKRFWRNGPKSTQYSQLLRSRERVDFLIQEISDLEESLSKACLALQTYRPDDIDKVKVWEKKSLDCKLDLYAQHQPESNRCQLAIFGSHPEPIATFYTQLLAALDFTWEAKTIWFREGYSNGAESDSRGEELGATAYLERTFRPEGKNNFQPKQKGEVLYGLAFDIRGRGCFLYLSEEEGLQRWRLSEEENYAYQVRVRNSPEAWPGNIHRRDFYKGNARRTIEPPNFRDTRMKIRREIEFKALLSLIKETLDQVFMAKLQAELL